ncbi:MAG: acetyl-coenzyme A synthetase, partial [Nitrospina sp.]|nr:acetyl-coenzyme A synthetase [Nitrospina sp.]
MSEELYYPPESVSSIAHIANMDQYREMYERSINSPDEFWAEQAERFCWFKRCDQVRSYNFDVTNGDIQIEWFKG